MTFEAHIIVTLEANDQEQAQERIDEIVDVIEWPTDYGLALVVNQLWDQPDGDEDEDA
jgi:hypothetical protein